ncbi:unnamed protein product [Protopolystoma xenopodis]|uniref:Uncharacterized protein n=1 Tax=Protopolystoma xenopodis TaxID=117903 RepID=A0A448WE15_9PLAT|nr:unnamed protein product [Protopolystoma xenopodis]
MCKSMLFTCQTHSPTGHRETLRPHQPATKTRRPGNNRPIRPATRARAPYRQREPVELPDPPAPWTTGQTKLRRVGRSRTPHASFRPIRRFNGMSAASHPNQAVWDVSASSHRPAHQTEASTGLVKSLVNLYDNGNFHMFGDAYGRRVDKLIGPGKWPQWGGTSRPSGGSCTHTFTGQVCK